MKIFTIIFFSVVTFQLNAQNRIDGEYYDSFGSRLNIYPDSTFKYTWRFDLITSWTIGTWEINNDTIYFTEIPIYDTVRYVNDKNDTEINSLVLSQDDKSDIITFEQSISNTLISGGQNVHQMPDKLYYRKDKLFEIKANGKLNKKKMKGIWTNKKYVPWYMKKE